MENYFPYEEVGGAGFDIESFLEGSLESERSRLEESLASVEELLEDRIDVRDQHLSDLESKLEWYVNRLDSLYRRPGSNPDERENLKKRIESLYSQIRTERKQAWRDRQELEAEKRKIRRQLSEVADGDNLADFLH